MNIERNDLPTVRNFYEITKGDIFITTDGKVYMKMDNIIEKNGDYTNYAVNLENGEVYFCKSFEQVILPHYAKLIIN